MQWPSKTMNKVFVRGAREHNLKDVTVEIPRDALVVFTGVSGSGKSSLAFGTIFAEAQRRYLESVAPYARRLIDQVGTPDVDAIEGLPPAVALQQQRGTPNARSSVGSVTTIAGLLRLLYSRSGHYPGRQPMLYAEDFSPNTAQGACPTCHGLGRRFDVSEALMVPDDSLTIRERAIAAWPPAWHGQNLRDILVSLGHDVDKPWRELPRKTRDWILYTEEHPTVPVYAGFGPAETRAALKRRMEPSYQGTFTGVRRYVLHTHANTQSELMKRRLSRFMTSVACPACLGRKLKPEALSITFAGVDIGTLSQWSLDKVATLLSPAAAGQFARPPEANTLTRHAAKRATAARVAAGGAAHAHSPDVRLTPELSEEKRLAAQRLAAEVVDRIASLQALGLGYLSLERSTPTLSPGELQRLRLATQIRSQLFGVIYVLDEPTAGLHPADGEALLQALDQLKQAGNSVYVVEHDLATMRRADWIVDVGPDAGEHGGHVLYSGPPNGLRDIRESHTARHLFGAGDLKRHVARAFAPRAWLSLRDVTVNNLRGVHVEFPIGAMTAVTGVSGSGKSSLVTQALVTLVGDELGHANEQADEGGPSDQETEAAGLASGRLDGGLQGIRRLVRVDQKPIGRTPRSNLATYTGLFDGVRRLFAATPAARARKYGAGRFSFNVAGGRCTTCEGEGYVSVEMLYMPSVFAPCPSCHGARFNEDTLKVTLRSKSIADTLRLTVEAACEFFAEDASILRPLTLLKDIGLGYLRLGQPATELSGGEAQRIKLATELQRAQRGNTLYVLDEPTTGLHPADAEKLMHQLDTLVAAGNTLVLVEHEMGVVARCDWVIDLGPGGGIAGGHVVVTGPPKHVAEHKASPTAPYLKEALHNAAG